MSSKPLEVRFPITELPMLVEKKSKQTDLNDTPEPMSLPINDLPCPEGHNKALSHKVNQKSQFQVGQSK